MQNLKLKKDSDEKMSSQDETGNLQKLIENLRAQIVQHKSRISRLDVLASEEGVSTEEDENT